MAGGKSSPGTARAGLDDPQTTVNRRAVLERKRFLRRVYSRWYAELARRVPSGAGRVLELGSGAGFFSEFVPGLITSDVLVVPGIRIVLDGHALPFPEGSLRAILLVNVLHHMARPASFLEQAARCLRPGGRVVMLEPWVTRWSSFVYRRLHHEPFEPDSQRWEFESSGPLSGANSALPWMVFERDRARFERDYPQLELEPIRRSTPLSYLLSGGFTAPSLLPGWTFPAWDAVERLLGPWLGQLAMFAQIELVKVGNGPASSPAD